MPILAMEYERIKIDEAEYLYRGVGTNLEIATLKFENEQWHFEMGEHLDYWFNSPEAADKFLSDFQKPPVGS